MFLNFTTSAAAGNRRPRFVLANAALGTYQTWTDQTAGPSTALSHIIAQGPKQTTEVFLSSTLVWAGLQTPAVLLAGGTFSTLTDNLAAGDQWGTPFYLVREWLEVQ